MATRKLAATPQNSDENSEFLLLKQTPPPNFGEEEVHVPIYTDLLDLSPIRATETPKRGIELFSVFGRLNFRNP